MTFPTTRAFAHLSRALFAFLVMWTPGVGAAPAEDLGGAIATLDGVPIPADQFMTALKQAGVSLEGLEPDDRERLKREILNEVIERELLLREAGERGLRTSPAEIARAIAQARADLGDAELHDLLAEQGLTIKDWEHRVRENLIVGRVLERLIPSLAPPGDAEVKAYYETHPAEFMEPEAVDVRQIVVATETEAAASRARLLAGASFEKEARTHSTAPEAANGGRVGWMERGRAPEGFDVVFTLKPGAISPVIHTVFGYHLFTVTAHRPERRAPYADVAETLRRQLAQSRRDEAVAAWIKDRLARAALVINEPLLAGFDGRSLP
ncbi:MAG: peptidyl-prolyl cis-trans isomerase [Nitrospiria bacterium]